LFDVGSGLKLLCCFDKSDYNPAPLLVLAHYPLLRSFPAQNDTDCIKQLLNFHRFSAVNPINPSVRESGGQTIWCFNNLGTRTDFFCFCEKRSNLPSANDLEKSKKSVVGAKLSHLVQN
jgi:hypothetical protein